MSTATLFSIIESPMHPDFSGIYQRAGIQEIKLRSTRKAISELKKQTPDYVVAEFFYGYGNNYAGVNISNLDVFLYSLQRYAPQAQVIVMVDKSERQYVDKLQELFSLHAVLQHPVSGADIEKVLSNT
jgi:hypothetical protein